MRNFATLFNDSSGHGSRKTFETMIEDMIDTFRNTTPALNQEFVQKIQIETGTFHRISFEKLICESCVSRLP